VLSVEAFQESETEVAVTVVVLRPVGTLGGVVSGFDGVVTEAVALFGLSPPALMAVTV
jgi:hypothetical protein